METRTVAEIVLGLALRMVPCPCACHFDLDPYESHTKSDCTTCHGTGQVAEFPGLRRHWEEPHTHVAVFDPYARYDHSKSIILDSEHPDIVAECEANRRRGWLPVTTTDALLEAARSILDDDGYIVIGKDGGIALVGFPEKLQQEDRVWMPGPDTRKALALALEAAKKQEVANAT